MGQMSLLPKATERQMKLLVQLFNIQANQVAHLKILQMIPASLVPRVQIGSIARQRLKPDFALSTRYKLLDLLGSVDFRTVPDHQQPFARYTLQVLEKVKTIQAIQRPLPCNGVAFSRQRQPAHDRQVIARLLVPKDRRLTLRRRGANDSRQQVEPGFVDKNQ